MTRERWDEIKRIVSLCLDVPTDHRAGRVAELCSGDPFLIDEVNGMLASYAELGDFMESPALEPEFYEAPASGSVGHYQLCERVGEGGMGVVYRAVRATDFQKQVAIKLVKPGMDTNFILRRFRHERQILARLDHPNIARLLDGGVTQDGRPYLAMEYVQGTPITEYCRQHQLTIPQRLELFLIVCSAVQYAHQNLLVHRDLKSSNILVTADGIPKLLDFGIAKLLEPNADATITSLRALTPECASPEQVRGEPVTTASDVYALGVLLYQILVGRSPYHFTTRTPEEIRRIVCEFEPPRPSAAQAVPEDLDNIVVMAMAKDPSRRYASADELAQDLRRYISCRPVLARKDSFRYRATKFIARHRTGSIALGLLALSLSAGIGTTLWEAHVARIERARADRRFNDVRELADSLIFDLDNSIRTLPGATAARKLVVDRGLKYLDRLSAEAGDNNPLRRELAVGYSKLAEVQGVSGVANLGNRPAAILSLQKAARLREQVLAAEPTSVSDRRALADNYDRLGDLFLQVGERQKTEEMDRKSLRIRQDLFPLLPPGRANKELAFSFYQTGQHRLQNGDALGSIASFQQALDSWEQALRADPGSIENQLNLSLVHKRIGAALIVLRQLPEALSHYHAALALDEQRTLATPNDARARMDLTFAYSDIGYILREQGDLAGALVNYQKVKGIREALAAADPKDERSQSSLAATYFEIGRVLWGLHDERTALASYGKALSMRESLLVSDPANRINQRDLQTTAVFLGSAYAQLATASRHPRKELADWLKSRDYYERARQMIAPLKADGSLRGDAAENARIIASQLPLCESAIKRLTSEVQ
jgi:serine/threonine protein kinase